MAFGAISTNNVIANPLTVPAPAGIADGDILVALCTSDAGTDTPTYSAGFDEVAGSPQKLTVFDSNTFGCAVKVAAAESGSYSLGNTTNIIGGVARFSGRNQSSTPHRVVATKADSNHASGSNIVSGTFSDGVTTVASDVIWIAIVDGAATADVTFTQPAGYTMAADICQSVSFDRQFAVAYKEGVAAGFDGALTGSAAGDSFAYAVYVLALADFEPTTSTFYLNNPVQGGSSAGLLDVTAPTASTSTTGWTVGTTAAARYSRGTYNAEVPATNFTVTAQPSGAPSTSAQDCYRLSGVTTGDFSAGTWYSSVSVIAVSAGGVQNGRARFRIWRSTNADGTGATEITQGAMIGSTVTLLDTARAQSSSASTQVAGFSLANEFLYMQVAWETG